MCCVCVCVCVFSTVWAKVELTMDETVEAYRGDLVQIPCQYNFTDNAKPSLVMIQWFVVSPGAGGQNPAVALGFLSPSLISQTSFLFILFHLFSISFILFFNCVWNDVILK